MAVYKNTKENNVNKKIKRVVALGIMFSVGVSAFCNGPGLFKDSQSINQKATNDICNMYNYMMEANSDGIVSSIEENNVQNIINQFDIDFGSGSCEKVFNTMLNYLNETTEVKEAAQKSINKVFNNKQNEKTVFEKTTLEKGEIVSYKKTTNNDFLRSF